MGVFRPDLASFAFFSSAACLLRLATRAIGSSLFLGPAYSSAAWGGAGGGPVPTTGATSAVLRVVEEIVLRGSRRTAGLGSVEAAPLILPERERSGALVTGFMVVFFRLRWKVVVEVLSGLTF